MPGLGGDRTQAAARRGQVEYAVGIPWKLPVVGIRQPEYQESGVEERLEPFADFGCGTEQRAVCEPAVAHQLGRALALARVDGFLDRFHFFDVSGFFPHVAVVRE